MDIHFRRRQELRDQLTVLAAWLDSHPMLMQDAEHVRDAVKRLEAFDKLLVKIEVERLDDD